MRKLFAACLLPAVVALAQTGADRLEQAAKLARQHRFREAKAAIEGLDPPIDTARRIAYYRVRAAVDSGTGDAAGASQAMEEALRLKPEDAQLRLATAAAQAGVGEGAEKHGHSLDAAHAYQRAVELAPEVEDYRLALGIELLQHQTFDPAILTLQAGVERFPDSPRMRTALGLAYFFVDRNADAVKCLLAAANYPPALDYLADIELHQTAPPDPAAVKQLCLNSNFDAVCGGLLLRQAVDSDDARERDEIFLRLEKAARAAPGDATARCELGKAYEWAAQWKEARTELEACERLDTDLAEVHYRLARVYRQLGEKELAAKEARLRDEAEKRQGEANERRYANLKRFLYSMEK